MPLPFRPGWITEVAARVPDGVERSDAPRVVAELRRLSFRPIGAIGARGVGEVPANYADGADNTELARKWTRGEWSDLFADADGTTIAEQSYTHGCDQLRFRSLSAQGVIVETRKTPERHPELADMPTGEELEPEARALWERTLGCLIGKTEDGMHPDFPLAGLRVRNLDADPEALWAAHRARIAGRPLVRVDDLQSALAVSYRAQHVQLTHVQLVERGSVAYQAATWAVVAVPPLAALWLWPHACVLATALTWVAAMWWLGRDLLVVVSVFWVLTPVVRWWPFPRPVRANHLPHVYDPR